MILRFCSAAIVASFVLGTSALAQVQTQAQGQVQTQFQPQAPHQLQPVHFRSLFKLPDPRGEFVRDHAAATIEDPDLREALLRGISETGVPTIETAWVPASKQSEIGPTFTKIAKPTLQCMFEPSTN
jgi:hypothetical protein